MSASRALLDLLGIDCPIIQAPMAGTSTPALAAPLSTAGALGSLGVAATDAAGARAMIADARARSSRSLNVNVFCHPPARADAAVEAAWLARLAPAFARFGARPPAQLREIYTTFQTDDAMLATLVELAPKVVSFHFGIPAPARVAALRQAGIVLVGTATSLAEGRALAAAGAHAVVAQGYEAGGQRAVFDAEAPDDQLTTLALTQLLARDLAIPVIAAGGIMNGAGIDAALRVGASAAQLGTAFVGCRESAADADYRAALQSDAALHPTMTRVISGRPAGCLANRFTAFGAAIPASAGPAYSITYDAGKALVAAAKAAASPASARSGPGKAPHSRARCLPPSSWPRFAPRCGRSATTCARAPAARSRSPPRDPVEQAPGLGAARRLLSSAP